MTETEIRDAYTKRASEYISLFGSVDKANEPDQTLVAHWAKSVSGPVVDVGCGPGHWTAFLTSLGVDAEGVDLVPAFVAHAKAQFPDATFRVASFGEAFPHVVTTAHFWSADAMAARLVRAGLEVVAVHTRTDPGQRPQTAMIARKSPSTSDSRLADAASRHQRQFHWRH